LLRSRRCAEALNADGDYSAAYQAGSSSFALGEAVVLLFPKRLYMGVIIDR
jgi:hypothetical protein